MRKASGNWNLGLPRPAPPRSEMQQLRRSRSINCDANVKCGKPLAEAEAEAEDVVQDGAADEVQDEAGAAAAGY